MRDREDQREIKMYKEKPEIVVKRERQEIIADSEWAAYYKTLLPNSVRILVN
jgi:hypothetical protein